MTYQDRPWLPPPLILLSHMTSGLRAVYRKLRGDPEREESGSGLSEYWSVYVCENKELESVQFSVRL